MNKWKDFLDSAVVSKATCEKSCKSIKIEPLHDFLLEVSRPNNSMLTILTSFYAHTATSSVVLAEWINDMLDVLPEITDVIRKHKNKLGYPERPDRAADGPN